MSDVLPDERAVIAVVPPAATEIDLQPLHDEFGGPCEVILLGVPIGKGEQVARQLLLMLIAEDGVVLDKRDHGGQGPNGQ